MVTDGNNLRIAIEITCHFRLINAHYFMAFGSSVTHHLYHTLTVIMPLSTHVKTHKLQVCKQVVTSLFTSCQQVVFALLVPSLL